jgi:hypothetical protein
LTASPPSTCGCTSAANYGGFHHKYHKDVSLAQIIGEVLRVNAGTIYVEGANPRHAHEWRVFDEVDLPDDRYCGLRRAPTVVY